MPDVGEALDALTHGLATEEQAIAASLPTARRRTWTSGRAALREALGRAALPAPAVLVDDRGAPRLPDGVAASISHKDALAVALVGDARDGDLGVDLEVDRRQDATRRPPVDISRRVMTPAELEALEGASEAERALRVLVAFSLKEAVYKALDPFVRRYVGFHEVSLRFDERGTAEVHLALPDLAAGAEVDGTWRVEDGLILTTARATGLRRS
jgi:4'-phosphopantetheinyl transferase EntD